MRALALAALLSLVACSRQPLPEEGTPTATLYEKRCGSCHRAYAPSVVRFPMWQMIFERMELRIAQARLPPLTATERRTLLDYLERNSG